MRELCQLDAEPQVTQREPSQSRASEAPSGSYGESCEDVAVTRAEPSAAYNAMQITGVQESYFATQNDRREGK